MFPIISIIVPVYNAEKTLHKCVDSIIYQSYKDWELLLIDDGSSDNSAIICDKYAQLDERIKVFHKLNGGVSSARNIGLNNAKGEWITFVDSDDLLMEDALNLNWHLFNEDFILFPFYIYNGNTTLNLLSFDSFGKYNIKYFLKDNLDHLIFRNPWSKIFRRDLIGDLRFNENMICGEDTLFVLMYLDKVKTCNVQKVPFYIFNQDNKDFCEKYRQMVDVAVYSLSLIFNALEKLHVKSPNFECNIFWGFKGCCQEEIDKNSVLWFHNTEVKKIYSKIKGYIGFEQRIKYMLLSYGLVSKINVYFRKRKSFID